MVNHQKILNDAYLLTTCNKFIERLYYYYTIPSFYLFLFFFSLYFNATTTNISVLIQAKQSIKINKSTFQIDSFIDYDLAYLTVHRQIHLLNIRKRIKNKWANDLKDWRTSFKTRLTQTLHSYLKFLFFFYKINVSWLILNMLRESQLVKNVRIKIKEAVKRSYHFIETKKQQTNVLLIMKKKKFFI